MVRIIERREDAGPDQTVFIFKVYRSPKDGTTILGYMEPYGAQTGEREVTWIKTDFGRPVADAFNQVIGMAEHYRADAVWVSDPDRYFPPEKRPVRDITR